MRIKLLKAFILTFLVISGFTLYLNFSAIYYNQDKSVAISFGGDEIKSSGSMDLVYSNKKDKISKKPSGGLPEYGELNMKPDLKSSPLKNVQASKSARSAKSYSQTAGAADYSYSAGNKNDEVAVYSGNNGMYMPQNGYTIRRSNKKQDDPELLAMQSISPQMLQTSRILAGTKINPAAATGVKTLASTTLDEIPFADAQLYGTTLTDDYVDPGGEDPVFLPVGDGLWILLMMSLCFAVYKRRSFTVN